MRAEAEDQEYHKSNRDRFMKVRSIFDLSIRLLPAVSEETSDRFQRITKDRRLSCIIPHSVQKMRICKAHIRDLLTTALLIRYAKKTGICCYDDPKNSGSTGI